LICAARNQPDGHTASLFPNDPALDELSRQAAAVARPDVDRVTATIPQLNASETVLFLIIGEEKADAAARSFSAPPDPATPAGLVRSASGKTIVLLDRTAADRLPN
jgi:6-phosphogluconolactonase